MINRILDVLPEVVDLLLDVVCAVDTKGNFVFVSAACERVFGYTQEEMIGRQMIDFVYFKDKELTLNAAEKVKSGYLQLHFENRYVRKNGSLVNIMWSARWSQGQRLRIAVARDVSALKRSELLQTALYAISEASHLAVDLVALFEKIHHIIDALLMAKSFAVGLVDTDTDQLTFPYDAVLPNPASGAPPLDIQALSAEVLHTGLPLLRNDEPWSVLVVPLRSVKNVIGTLVLASHSGQAHYSLEDQELLEFVSTQIATAIERKQLHEKLRDMAVYDQLTGLYSRSFLIDRFESAIKRTRRGKKELSVIYLDLDKLKKVNDTLGHHAGDLLLQEVARRLKSCLRESDVIGRMGGDEFVVLLEDTDTAEYARVVGDKIRTSINGPIEIEGHAIHVAISLGIALYPQDGITAQQLFKHADQAMYLDKKTRLH